MNKQNKTPRYRWVVTREKTGWGEGKMCTRSQKYADGWKLDFGWRAGYSDIDIKL